jgi:hypothetical protein
LKLCIRPIQGDALLFCLSLVAIHNGAGECGSLGVVGSQRKEERARRHNTAEKDGADRSAVMMAWALMDFSSIFASSFPFSCLFSFLLRLYRFFFFGLFIFFSLHFGVVVVVVMGGKD